MIKLPNINESTCPVDPTTVCQSDGDPDLIPDLIVKPAIAQSCFPADDIQFSAFFQNSQGEVEVTTAAIWTTSDAAVATVGAATGLVSIVGPGIATITATWQTHAGYSQIEVLDGEDCCDEVAVGTCLLVDASASMRLPFIITEDDPRTTPLAVSKFQAAITLANGFAAGLNESKDQMGLVSFKGGPTNEIAFGSSIAALQAAIAGIVPATIDGTGSTDIAGAFDMALGLFASTAYDRNVIVLVSDGENRTDLTDTERDALLLSAEGFKSAGGIIICVGIRAYGDGFSLLQNMATPGFFINVLPLDDSATQIASALAMLLGLTGYYCGGTRPPPAYGYTCSNFNCLDEPPGPQVPDPNPLIEVEAGIDDPDEEEELTQLPAPKVWPGQEFGYQIADGLNLFTLQLWSISNRPANAPRHVQIRYTVNGVLQPPGTDPVHPPYQYFHLLTTGLPTLGNPSFVFPASADTGLDYEGDFAPLYIVRDANTSPTAVAVIKAIARAPGYKDSPVSTTTYSLA